MATWNGQAFALPLPTPANELVRPALLFRAGRKPTARLVKTAAGQGWLSVARARITVIWQRIGRPSPLAGPVRLDLRFHFRTIASDADGRIKALQDALTGCIWEDDRQVAELSVRKLLLDAGSHPDAERVEVVVSTLPPDGEHAELARRLEASKSRKETTGKVRFAPAVYR